MIVSIINKNYMLFKSRKKYSIIFYLPIRNMHPPRLFNRARQNPVSSCPGWLESMPDQEFLRLYMVTGILTRMKTQPSGCTPEADLSAIPI